MPNCCALNCSSVDTYKSRKAGISFHRFPSNDAMRKRWLEAMNISKEPSNKQMFLCSKHFLPQDYFTGGSFKVKRLKPWAVPSGNSKISVTKPVSCGGLTAKAVRSSVQPCNTDERQLGDICYAKVFNYPWWPCMIYPGLSNSIVKKQGNKTWYHVQYFGKDVERGWVLHYNLYSFETIGDFKRTLRKERKHLIISSKSFAAWQAAYQEALEGTQMSVTARLQWFGRVYVSYKKKKRSKVNKDNGSNDDDMAVETFDPLSNTIHNAPVQYNTEPPVDDGEPFLSSVYSKAVSQNQPSGASQFADVDDDSHMYQPPAAKYACPESNYPTQVLQGIKQEMVTRDENTAPPEKCTMREVLIQRMKQQLRDGRLPALSPYWRPACRKIELSSTQPLVVNLLGLMSHLPSNAEQLYHVCEDCHRAHCTEEQLLLPCQHNCGRWVHATPTQCQISPQMNTSLRPKLKYSPTTSPVHIPMLPARHEKEGSLQLNLCKFCIEAEEIGMDQPVCVLCHMQEAPDYDMHPFILASVNRRKMVSCCVVDCEKVFHQFCLRQHPLASLFLSSEPWERTQSIVLTATQGQNYPAAAVASSTKPPIHDQQSLTRSSSISTVSDNTTSSNMHQKKTVVVSPLRGANSDTVTVNIEASSSFRGPPVSRALSLTRPSNSGPRASPAPSQSNGSTVTIPPTRSAPQQTDMICMRHSCFSCFIRTNAPTFLGKSVLTMGPLQRGSHQEAKIGISCILCPRMFHMHERCVPAGSLWISPVHIACPEHEEFIASHRDTELSAQGSKTKQPKILSRTTLGWCYICQQRGEGEFIYCTSCPLAFHARCLLLTRSKSVSCRGDFVCMECRMGNFYLPGDCVWVWGAQDGMWWPGQVLLSYKPHLEVRLFMKDENTTLNVTRQELILINNVPPSCMLQELQPLSTSNEATLMLVLSLINRLYPS